MIAALDILMGFGQDALWSGFVVFLRIGAMMLFLPAFGEGSVPGRVKVAIGIGFTLVVLPAVAPDIPAYAGPTATVALVAAETLAGLFFGLLLRLFVIALQIAGTIAAQSTSLSQLFGGSAGAEPQPAIGHLLTIGGLALAAVLGLHVRLALFMVHTYTLSPFGQVIAPDVVSATGLSEIARAFALAFTLAGPFVVASLIYNVTLGIINRAMPQLMVAFVGAPAITAGGLGLLLLTAPILLSIWVGALDGFMENPFSGAP